MADKEKESAPEPVAPRQKQDGQVPLYHKTTGAESWHWPIDARDIVNAPGSEYTDQLGGASDEPLEDGEEIEAEEQEGLPALGGMKDHLAGITTVDEVKALRKTDKRKGAKALYAARIKELEEAE